MLSAMMQGCSVRHHIAAAIFSSSYKAFRKEPPAKQHVTRGESRHFEPAESGGREITLLSCAGGGCSMLTIAHIVNPVIVPESSDLFIAQPITFETMRIAREFSKHSVSVFLFSAQYPEDHAIIPPYFKTTRDLDRSILDTDRQAGKRKLPLIRDILDRVYEISNADYFVYTNVDIGLRPEFYLAISDFVKGGHDAFSITRRTISPRFQSINDLPQIYLEEGKPHPGWDCFVFRRTIYPQFDLGNVCIGVPPIGRVLLCNCMRYAERFALFTDEHLTFHIGDDGAWKNTRGGAERVSGRSGSAIIRSLHQGTDDSSLKPLLKHHLDALERRRPGKIEKSLKKAKKSIKKLRRKIVRRLPFLLG
jgi:hypothetical protein